MIGGVAVALVVAVGVVVRRWMERERAWRRELEEDPVYLAGLSVKMRREREAAERAEENLYEELPEVVSEEKKE